MPCCACQWLRAGQRIRPSGWPIMPLSVYRIFTMFSGRIFMAITLEFVLHFTGTKSRRFVRGVQIGVLLVPFVYFIRLIFVYQVLSVASEVLFCGLVVVLLYQRVAKGKK